MDKHASQPGLAADLRRTAMLLERHAGTEAGDGASGAPPGPAPRPAADAEGSPLDLLYRTFGLSDFERDLLLLCAGVELDADCAALVASIQQGAPPTPSLALAALPDAHWSALLPTSPLRYWRLIEFGAGASLVGATLRIDERILHYLVGLQFVDDRLAGLVDVAAPPPELVPSQLRLAERIAGLWQGALDSEDAVPVVQLCGDDPAARRDIAAYAAALVGSPLLALNADDLAEGREEFERTHRLWEREALLVSGCRMLIADGGAPDKATDRRIERIVDAASGPLILSSATRRPAGERTMLTFDVARPPPGERLELWREALGDRAPPDPSGLRRLAFQFDLDIAAIRAAAADGLAGLTLANGGADGGAGLHDALWDACRRQARAGLGEGVQLIEPAVQADALVLPAREQQMLSEIVAQVRHRALVYGDWGFAEAGGRGLGLAALFAGPSGTGKTMAAETIAGKLRLDLFRIDLSAVVDKYIGETEKKLKRVFDAAEAGGAVLLFDEADALFGKRSEVKDSHDRHANVEVAYLLQRIEAYRGLAILTTNLKENLDQAFLRRLRFIVQFPFPDAAQRQGIWQGAFPPATPVEDLHFDRLAQLDITGGSIRNIALNAAFRSAAEDGPVTMSRIKAAARAEYAKLGKTLTDGETRGWK